MRTVTAVGQSKVNEEGVRQVRLKSICMFCGNVYRIRMTTGYDKDSVSHGYCNRECADKQMKELEEAERN